MRVEIKRMIGTQDWCALFDGFRVVIHRDEFGGSEVVTVDTMAPIFTNFFLRRAIKKAKKMYKIIEKETKVEVPYSASTYMGVQLIVEALDFAGEWHGWRVKIKEGEKTLIALERVKPIFPRIALFFMVRKIKKLYKSMKSYGGPIFIKHG